MAAMAALQSSFTSLSLSSNSTLSPRFSTCLAPPTVSMVRTTKTPFVVQARIKRWERIKCKPNSLPIIPKMHVKVGDTVKVISGRDKGKIGEILKVIKHKSVVVVDDVNVKTKHVKPQKNSDEPGQIITMEAPIHSSNVMLYSKEKEVASRVGHKVLENGKRVRYLIKTGEIIDNAEKWQKMVKEREEGSSALVPTN